MALRCSGIQALFRNSQNLEGDLDHSLEGSIMAKAIHTEPVHTGGGSECQSSEP